MKNTPSERFHWLHKQLAYNIVQLCERIASCRRSSFEHKRHEQYAYEAALATQRNTLNWLPEKDRRAVLAQAREEMKEVRRSRLALATYPILSYSAVVTLNGRETKWCHVAHEYAFHVDIKALARSLAECGAASANVDGREIFLEARAVAA